MEREEGYYWVKHQGCWEVAWYSGKNWFLSMIEEPFKDTDFDQIDERRIINPNE